MGSLVQIGQQRGVPVLAAMLLEQQIDVAEVLSKDLIVRYEEFVATVGPENLVLSDAEERASATAEHLRTIAEHASRQPDGVWPKNRDR